jgi:intein-encoded DNA endonuclease-like protein
MHRELNHDFFKKWSPEMAYVLGFFAADGSMIRNKRGAHFIEFTITDRIVLEQIQQATNSTHRIAKRKQRANHKTAYRLQIGSREWFEDLSGLGFMQNKSKRLPLPKIPQKYFGDFVRGYFDGDGCVYFNRLKFADRKKHRLILLTLFTSGSYSFLDTLWGALKTQGVHGGSLKNKTRGFELVLSHRDSVALHHIMYHTGKTPELWLPRKRNKLENAIRELKMRE